MLLKAVINAFMSKTFPNFLVNYITILCASFLSSTLEMSAPFIINSIINKIQAPDSADKDLYLLVLLLVLSQAAAYFIVEHVNYYSVMVGIRSQSALTGLIYRKQFMLSQATNKEFNQGKIINFVQVDVGKMTNLSAQLNSLAKLPIAMGFSIFYCFFILGWSWLAGIAIFVIAFYFNLYIGRWQAKLQKKVMTATDDRMNMTTEALTNIKMLKLYSLVEYFKQQI